MSKYLWLFVFLFLCSTLLPAEQLFVRNKPFKGATKGVGRSRMCELVPLAEALGFTVRPFNGGFLVVSDPTSDQASELCETGVAMVDGNKVELSTGTGGETLVSLSDFCNCTGAKLVLNHDMGSADVYLEAKAKVRGPSLRDHWGSATAEKGEGSRGLPEGPGKVAVQFFETFGQLPPARDVRELRGLCQRKSDFARFWRTYESIVTPTLYSKSAPTIKEAIEETVSVSTLLSAIPPEELEQYLASKPEMSQRFLKNLSAWEVLRSGSATFLDQEVRGSQALVNLEQILIDPVTQETEKNNLVVLLIRSGRTWKVSGLKQI